MQISKIVSILHLLVFEFQRKKLINRFHSKTNFFKNLQLKKCIIQRLVEKNFQLKYGSLSNINPRIENLLRRVKFHL